MAFYAWRRRGVPGATALTLLTAAAAWWAIAYALSLNAPDAPTKFLWGDAKYLGIVAVAPTWLAFALQYTGRGGWLNVRTSALLAAFPLVTLLVIFTNGYHGLFWRSREPSAPWSFPTIEPVYGPWFWAHLAYSYALTLLGAALLFRALFSSRLYRGQRVALLVDACVPWAGNAVNVSGLVPAAYPDPAPFAFAISGAAFAWGLSRRGLLDVVPVARDAVVEDMRDGVAVLDAQDRVVDLNPAAERALGRSASEAVGQSAARVLPDPVVRLLEEHRGEEEARGEARLGEGAGVRDYELALSPLREGRGGFQAGRLVVLRDVTERKVLEERLERQALHDSLTDLPNRRLFSDRLEHALARSSGGRGAEGRGGTVAVLFLDLDGLKGINDSWGHEAGDQLLVESARRIEACVRPGDTVARFGGDEFAVLL